LVLSICITFKYPCQTLKDKFNYEIVDILYWHKYPSFLLYFKGCKIFGASNMIKKYSTGKDTSMREGIPV
jgi:hypothetical protein